MLTHVSGIGEVAAEGHRALVFSQFTSHLALVREALDRDKFRYLYLDGATPQEQRADLIKRFQSGEGDLFLISLKAGGTGINLTAADYVIHLDPWWNPAVEDQATDRAWRIGQTRPVVVHRFISEGTIDVQHNFNFSGTYTVTHIVTSNTGGQTTCSTTITVQ